MSLTYNGKPFRSEDLVRDMMKTAKDAAAQELQERISAI
jgi:hypothetical protein